MILLETISVSEVSHDAYVKVDGAVILSRDFSGTPKLMARGRFQNTELSFSDSHSPKLKKKFPHALNADSARLVTHSFEAFDLPLHIFLENSEGTFSQLVKTLDLPELDSARGPILAKHYANVPDFRKSGRFNRTVSFFQGLSRTIDGLKARAIFFGRYRLRPSKLGLNMARLRDLLEKDGAGDEFSAFEAQLKRHDAHVVSPHANETLSTKNSDQLWNEYNQLAGKIKNLGYDVFINSGTLLGVVRDGTFLPHDDDIDIAVILPGNDQITAAESFLAFEKAISSAGLSDSDGSTPGMLRAKRIDGVQIDIFPCWFDADDRAYIYPHTYGNLHKDQILPLERWKDYENIHLPRDHKSMLEINYGQNWRVPDPYFRFVWSDAKKKFSTLLSKFVELKNA